MTEVGVFPEDWEETTLGEIGSFTKGGGISRDESQSGSIPAIRYGELYIDQHNYIREFHSFISREVAEKARLIKKGDLLFTASGETKEDIGKSVAYAGDEEAYAGGDLIVLTPKRDLDPIFMGYLSNTPYVAKQKASKGQGDAVVHITARALSDVKIVIPPLKEQLRISKNLCEMDEIIGGLTQEISKKKLLKEGVMQQLLTGKTRLAGFSGEWCEVKLGDILTVKSGYPFKSEMYSTFGNYKIITISNVKNGKLDMSEYNKLTTCPIDLQNHHKLKIGDIIVSMTGNVGRVCIVDTEKCLLNQRVGFLSFDKLSQSDKDFIYTILNSRKFETYLIKKGQGAAQANIGNKDIESYSMYIPKDVNEQTAIANILSDFDAEIKALEAERDKYALIKQGMMQKLLTGQIRLK